MNHRRRALQARALPAELPPHKIYQNKSRIRTDSHRLRAYAGYSPEPGITLRVFQFAPPYPSRLDWTRIRDFHHIFSGVIQISLLPPSPTQGGASNISANSRGGAPWSCTTFSGFSVQRIHYVCQISIILTGLQRCTHSAFIIMNS